MLEPRDFWVDYLTGEFILRSQKKKTQVLDGGQLLYLNSWDIIHPFKVDISVFLVCSQSCATTITVSILEFFSSPYKETHTY